MYVSELVHYEVAAGDPDAARARLAAIDGLTVLRINPAARSLATLIFRATTLSEKATADTLHIALAAVNSIDFLLTWNCAHIANGVVLKVVNAVCRDNGYDPPIVCTPEELMTP